MALQTWEKCSSGGPKRVKKWTCKISATEMITIRFAGWISGRIVSLQPDKDIQKLLSNGNRIRIRISETLLSIFRWFQTFEKICTLHNHSFIIFRSISSAFCAMTPSLSMMKSLNRKVMTSLSAWIFSWCGKIGHFQCKLGTLFAAYLD